MNIGDKVICKDRPHLIGVINAVTDTEVMPMARLQWRKKNTTTLDGINRWFTQRSIKLYKKKVSMKKLVIMQGIPGCGKGFVIKRDYPNAKVCSADNYFRGLNPEYDNGGQGFDPTQLGAAHKACFAEAHGAMLFRSPIVVIDNTNLDNESIAGYVSLAGLHEYDVEICRVSCDPEIAFMRNTHGVPEQAYSRMAAAFDKWQMWMPHKFGGVKCVAVDNNPLPGTYGE